MNDYYYILGVSKSCSMDEIKKAYRKLSHKFHPDKNGGDIFFADRFKDINQAYEILGDPIKRKQYDILREKGQTKSTDHKNNFLPIIEYFTSETDEFEYDKEVKFSWKTINADLVTIEPFGIVEPVGAGKYKFKNIESKELVFELTATNTYINKSCTAIFRLRNKTYFKFYERVKDNFEKEQAQKEDIGVKEKAKPLRLIPFRKGNKWGFCNDKREVIIDFLYDDAFSFKEGLAAVSKNGKWGFIDEAGIEITECKYDIASSFNEGLGLVTLKYQTGYIDRSGNRIIPFKYLDGFSFKNELAGVREFNWFQKILLELRLVREDFYSNWLLTEQRRYGFIDKTGRLVIPAIYNRIGLFNEDLAPVKIDSKYGYIDKTGKEILPFIFDDASVFNEGLAGVKIFKGKKNNETTTKYIDKMGNERFSFKYDDVHPFREGLARVEFNVSINSIGKYGFINKNGAEVIGCKYSHAKDFSEGLAAVGLDNKYGFSSFGFIDKYDKIVIQFKYKYADNFRDELARVSYNGKYGYIDKNGVEYWED